MSATLFVDIEHGVVVVCGNLHHLTGNEMLEGFDNGDHFQMVDVEETLLARPNAVNIASGTVGTPAYRAGVGRYLDGRFEVSEGSTEEECEGRPTTHQL